VGSFDSAALSVTARADAGWSSVTVIAEVPASPVISIVTVAELSSQGSRLPGVESSS